MPAVVVWAESRNNVVNIMHLAHRERIPVYPRGAGSGLTGGALAVHGGIALDMSKMDQIIKLNKIDQQVVIQPGVVVKELQDYVLQYGLFYPPDPSSSDYATDPNPGASESLPPGGKLFR